jgi:hypothetical protein
VIKVIFVDALSTDAVPVGSRICVFSGVMEGLSWGLSSDSSQAYVPGWKSSLLVFPRMFVSIIN